MYGLAFKMLEMLRNEGETVTTNFPFPAGQFPPLYCLVWHATRYFQLLVLAISLLGGQVYT